MLFTLVSLKLLTLFDIECLKSLGSTDRKFHGHGKNDGLVL